MNIELGAYFTQSDSWRCKQKLEYLDRQLDLVVSYFNGEWFNNTSTRWYIFNLLLTTPSLHSGSSYNCVFLSRHFPFTHQHSILAYIHAYIYTNAHNKTSPWGTFTNKDKQHNETREEQTAKTSGYLTHIFGPFLTWKKTNFKNLHFERGLPYTPMLRMGQFAVVRDSLWDLWSYGYENMAQSLYLDTF